MAWDASLLVEEEEEPKSGWDPSLLVGEPEPPSKLEQANADLAELGQVLQERQREQGPTIGPSELNPLQRFRTSAIGRSIAGPTREERAAMVAQQPSVTDIGKTMLKFTTAPPQITEPVQEATEPLISKLPPVPAGIARGVRDTAIGALGSLPAGALLPARLVAAPFAADYASTIPEQFQAIRESETPEQTAQALTTTALGGALTVAGTAQALKPARSLVPAIEKLSDIPSLDALPPELTPEGFADKPLPERIIQPEKASAPLRQPVKPGTLVRLKDGSEAVIDRDSGGTVSITKPSGATETIPSEQVWWDVANVPEVSKPEVKSSTPASIVLQPEKAPTPAATGAGAEVIPAGPSIAAQVQATSEPLKFWGFDKDGNPKWSYKSETARFPTQITEVQAKAKNQTLEPAPTKAEWEAGASARAEAEALGKAKAAELFGNQKTPAPASLESVPRGTLEPIESVGPGAASPKEFLQRERREPTGSTPVGLPGEAKPNIEVARANKDYNLFNNINSSQWAFQFGKLGESAKGAIERIFTGEFRMRENINKDTRVYVERTISSLPRQLKKQGGKAFFDVVNGKKMEEIRSEWEGKAGGDKVIAASEQLKTRLEEVRTTIRDTKRESYNAYLKSLDKPVLDDLFSKNMGEGVDVSRFDQKQMADALTLSSLPDDWGIADGTYLPHLFFGNYKVTAGEGAFVTRAKTLAEAKAKIYQLTKNNPEMAKSAFKVEQDTVVPADMIRLGDKNFWKMVGKMKESLGVSAAEIKEAQAGVIGRKTSKQKWFGSLQERQGFEGYSKDFKQVMTAYLNGFHRWKELSAMQRDVQPLIEQVRSEGRPNAANRLDEIMENLWGKPAKSTVEFDAFVRQIPGVRDWIKPLALDRWSRNVRSLVSNLTLLTARFAVVDRLQPLLGLYPIVGERLLANGKVLQHSAEGKVLLEEGGVSFDIGQYGETGARGKLANLKDRLTGEKTNRELAFLSMFLHGQEQGMSRVEAIRYAKLRGQLMTQFTPLVSDVPKAFEGPFGQLAFQFKRFPVKQAELAAQLVRERNFGGITRMLGVFAVMGGASFFMRQAMLDKEKQLRMRRALESELGKKGADVAMYGLPGLVGADLSGSLVLGDEPFGENIYEKAGRQLAGPAVSLAYETGKNILKSSRQPMTGMEKTKAVIRRIPSLKPLAELADLESGNTDVLTPDGEVKYHRAVSDAVAGLGSFRSANEANKQLTINGIIELKKETQALKNDVFMSLNSDPSKALDAVKAFNARWPEAAITADELTGYLKRRQAGARKTDEERTAGRKFRSLTGQ